MGTKEIIDIVLGRPKTQIGEIQINANPFHMNQGIKVMLNKMQGNFLISIFHYNHLES